ncbi:MAG: ATP-binding cassette domain-containing protein [Ilumatobacteraceae bacterium]
MPADIARDDRALDVPPIVRTTRLSKTYPGGIEAVVELDMEIRAGEIYGFLGPNGAGKSTTIGMLTTRVSPTSGDAEVGGVDIIHDPALAKQVIGVVPQTNTLDRAMTVAENLFFHGRYFGMTSKEAKAVTDELLVKVRLSDRAPAPVMALSGGMAQRLMVARAIMHRPQILFLDEPTAGLDPQSRIALWEIIGELRDEGETILLTTHYMEEADELCDRVAIMDHGRILALDTPDALKRSTGAGTVVKVTADPADAECLGAYLVETVDGASDFTVVDGVVLLSAESGTGLLPRIIGAAEQIDVDVTDLSVSDPSLETVFINLTGKDLRE